MAMIALGFIILENPVAIFANQIGRMIPIEGTSPPLAAALGAALIGHRMIWGATGSPARIFGARASRSGIGILSQIIIASSRAVSRALAGLVGAGSISR